MASSLMKPRCLVTSCRSCRRRSGWDRPDPESLSRLLFVPEVDEDDGSLSFVTLLQPVEDRGIILQGMQEAAPRSTMVTIPFTGIVIVSAMAGL